MKEIRHFFDTDTKDKTVRSIVCCNVPISDAVFYGFRVGGGGEAGEEGGGGGGKTET